MNGVAISLASMMVKKFHSITVSELAVIRSRSTQVEYNFDVCASALLRLQDRATTRLYQKNVESAVSINYVGVKQDEITLNEIEEAGYGAGFILDSRGHIITNYHVIQCPSNRLWVTLADASRYEANVAGFDEDNDIAVLLIDVAGKLLTPIQIGASANLNVGQTVYAIGNPFELNNTFTAGRISAVGRTIRSNTGYTIQNVIQHDSAINPGNSGGPLLDINGEVIGINTQIRSNTGVSCGIGFAVPIDLVVGIVEGILKSGRVTRHMSMQRLGVNGVRAEWSGWESGTPAYSLKHTVAWGSFVQTY